MAKKDIINQEDVNECCDGKEELTEEEILLESELKEDTEFEGMEETAEKIGDNNLSAELKEENMKLKNQVERLNNELEALKDRLLRTNAEYDNFRKRTSKEKEGIYTDACVDVLKEVLPVLDNLERASAAEGNVDSLKKGIDMTIRQFSDSLSKLNVEEIAAEGEFDPNLHNAVMHVEDEGCGKNSVVEVFQKGYKRGDKVIRHSMVKVAN